jgi:hypothetical protein
MMFLCFMLCYFATGVAWRALLVGSLSGIPGFLSIRLEAAAIPARCGGTTVVARMKNSGQTAMIVGCVCSLGRGAAPVTFGTYFAFGATAALDRTMYALPDVLDSLQRHPIRNVCLGPGKYLDPSFFS